MRIATPDDPAWQDAYQQLPLGKRDVFHSPGFAKACAAGLYENDTVLCAIETKSRSGQVIYPFVERELGPMIPWSETAQSLRDTTGLYGRGGPICSAEGALESFHDQLAEYFRERSIITSFDRYHPVLQNEHAAAPNTEIRETGDFVIISLAPDMETIEAHYKGKQRNTLRKSERAGVTVEFDRNDNGLDDFLRVYAATMKRQSAGDFYSFPRSFYEALFEQLPNNILLANGRVDGAIVSSDLILYEVPYAHLFLSGTSPEHLGVSPNTKVKHESFRYLREMGITHYLLGGGHNPDDGVYKYKRSFDPNGHAPSLVGCAIHAGDAYNQLNQEFALRGQRTCAQRFQFYEG